MSIYTIVSELLNGYSVKPTLVVLALGCLVTILDFFDYIKLKEERIMQQRRLFKRVLAAILTIIVLIVAYNWFKADEVDNKVDLDTNLSENSGNQVNSDQTSQNNQSQLDNINSIPGQFVTGIENLPRSLQGTDVDGEIIIDGNNNLVPTRGLRRLYDYFLSALGEESAKTIDERVETYISSRTPNPAASTAIEIYFQYKAYLNALSEIQNKFGGLQTRATEAGELDLNLIAQRQNAVKKLRNDLFSAETISAFFDSDDQLHDYNINMMQISKDASLSESQKQQARQDYVSRLPDSLMKERVYQKEAFNTLIDETERLKSKGASDAELFAMRAELVGIPAAERLSIVDQKNKDFDQRFEHYKLMENQINTISATPIEKQNQINNLKNELFDEAEKKRLEGYAELKKLKEVSAQEEK